MESIYSPALTIAFGVAALEATIKRGRSNFQRIARTICARCFFPRFPLTNPRQTSYPAFGHHLANGWKRRRSNSDLGAAVGNFRKRKNCRHFFPTEPRRWPGMQQMNKCKTCTCTVWPSVVESHRQLKAKDQKTHNHQFAASARSE